MGKDKCFWCGKQIEIFTKTEQTEALMKQIQDQQDFIQELQETISILREGGAKTPEEITQLETGKAELWEELQEAKEKINILSKYKKAEVDRLIKHAEWLRDALGSAKTALFRYCYFGSTSKGKLWADSAYWEFKRNYDGGIEGNY